MKSKVSIGKGTWGFTLIEMIGVLAIIAILAAVLTPKVFRAISRSKVNSTILSYNSIRTAVAEYYSKSNAFPLRAGTGATDAASSTGRFDADLLAGAFTEKLFSCPIGSQLNDGSALTGRTHIRTQTAANNATVKITSSAGGDNFDLDRSASTADFTTANTVCSLMIPSVAISEAIELNKLVDNDANSSTTSQDITGRCIYSTPKNGVTTVFVYVAHH